MTDYNHAVDLAEQDLGFGLSLMNHLGLEGKNISISPLSIRLALSMLSEGAQGETAKQILKGSLLPENHLTRQLGYSEIMSSLNAEQSSDTYTLRAFNGLWTAQKYPINPGFVQTLRDFYKAEAESLDFVGDSEGARNHINGKISDVTEARIPELFGAGSIDSTTRAVLGQAVYFKAKWLNRFDEENTIKQEFRLSSGEKISVDMMRKGEIEGELPKFYYSEFDGVQAALLPYKGNKLSKMVILAPRGSSMGYLENCIRGAELTGKLFYRMESREFSRLELPKHVIRSDINLRPPLEKLGIEDVFQTDMADLSGINPELYVSSAVHKTFFKTDEEGSEGAGGTGATLRMKGCIKHKEPVEFVCDRPFLEMIVDRVTASILFLNRVEDPR